MKNSATKFGVAFLRNKHNLARAFLTGGMYGLVVSSGLAFTVLAVDKGTGVVMSALTFPSTAADLPRFAPPDLGTAHGSITEPSESAPAVTSNKSMVASLGPSGR